MALYSAGGVEIGRRNFSAGLSEELQYIHRRGRWLSVTVVVVFNWLYCTIRLGIGMRSVLGMFTEAATLEMTLLLALATIPTVHAADICHGRNANEDMFVGSDAELVTCLNAGGISGLAINSDQLTYAVRKTTSPLRLRNVMILETFSTARAAFVSQPHQTYHQCAVIYDPIKRGSCSELAALPNDVDLENVWSKSPLDFSKTVFLGKVRLADVTAKMLWLDDSVFSQSLQILRPRTANGLSLGGIVAQDRIELVDVTDDLSIIGSEFSGPFASRMLNIGQFYVKQAYFWGATQFALSTLKDAFIYESTFKSDLDLKNARIGTPATSASLSIANSEVAGQLDLRNASITGELRLSSKLAEKARLDGLTSATRCTINVDCR
ncbi:hypothetical protein [Microvirga sesbaniae]|uniref:hypothetical protein n=1 Tax=Microvirga sesbaniae TaxID=681392 RepID=UPI0021C5B315|nr:hypothetical protein [Microvirga sp. HBU67692]